MLLAGLAPFAALVWLPASKDVGAGRDAVRSFGPLAWVLLYVLVIAGVAEVSVYATVASGESLGLRPALGGPAGYPGGSRLAWPG